MKKPLTLENVELGALIDTANGALAEICADVIDRHYKTDARELTIKVQIKPEVVDVAPGRRLNRPSIDWQVSTKLPGHKGMTTRAFVEGDKMLINTGDPLGQDNPDQMTIYDEAES